MDKEDKQLRHRRRSSGVGLSVAATQSRLEDQELLDVGDVVALIHAAKDVLSDEPNVVHVDGTSTYIFGDFHGQFYDLIARIDSIGLDRIADGRVKLLFLGDYIDRGAFSCEVMLYLLLLKLRYPFNVFLLRGNHECEAISSFYGFRGECRAKYGIAVYYHFISCFRAMPIAALTRTYEGMLFCVHGGISPDLKTLQDVQNLDRFREIPHSGLLCDLVWSDPNVQDTNGEPQWETNAVRGCSYSFNAAALFQFLEKNELVAMVRAHEFEEHGYKIHFHGSKWEAMDRRSSTTMPPLLTVFSSPNYCDRHGNKAAYLHLNNDECRWELKEVSAVDHPPPALIFPEGRGVDIWREFMTKLPFLPASRKIFDTILEFSKEPRGTNVAVVSGSDQLSNLQPPRGSMDEMRQTTNEMHPHARRRVLSDVASAWVKHQQKETGETLLEQSELDMLKFMFTLIDVSGSMRLSSEDIRQFVRNSLGSFVTEERAKEYLDAMDFNKDGVVDFSDMLSWVAVMKQKRQQRDETLTRRSARLLVVESGVVLLVLYIAHRNVSKASFARLMRTASNKSVLAMACLVLATTTLSRLHPTAWWKYLSQKSRGM